MSGNERPHTRVDAGVATGKAYAHGLPKPHRTRSGAGQLAKANDTRRKLSAKRAASVYKLSEEGHKPAQVAQRILLEWGCPAEALPSVELRARGRAIAGARVT